MTSQGPSPTKDEPLSAGTVMADSIWSKSPSGPKRVATVKPVTQVPPTDPPSMDLLSHYTGDAHAQDGLDTRGEVRLRNPEGLTDRESKAVKRLSLRRLKAQELGSWKKEALIEELEKCLVELEDEYTTSQDIGDSFEKIEKEKNDLLDELEFAFHDLQEYMHRQKQAEKAKNLAEQSLAAMREEKKEQDEELQYLKEVLQSRNHVTDQKLDAANEQ